MKLLAIRIVANNFFGFTNWSRTRSDLGSFSEFNTSLSFASIEKKATSDPDIKAELISNTAITSSEIATGREIELIVNKNPPKGSILEGSNKLDFYE